MRRPRHWRALALAATTMGLAITAAPAVLAAIPKLDVYPAEHCVLGHWPDGTSVTFQLRTAGGTLKDQQVGVADEGFAAGCFAVPIVPGDRIRVKQGANSRTITALKLKPLVIDRAVDQVKGDATGGRPLRMRVDRCTLSQGFSSACADALLLTKTVPSSGSYTFDTTASLNLRGRDLVEVILRNDAGDRFRRGGTVPVFFLTLDSPFIGGVFPPGPTIEFQLLDTPGGTVKATAALPSPARQDSFNNGTSDVPVEAGDQVTGEFSIDAKMVIPAMVTSVDPATDVVQATCFPNRPYELIIFGAGALQGTANASGGIVRDFGDSGFDIPADYSGRLDCLAATGDSIRQSFAAD